MHATCSTGLAALLLLRLAAPKTYSERTAKNPKVLLASVQVGCFETNRGQINTTSAVTQPAAG